MHLYLIFILSIFAALTISFQVRAETSSPETSLVTSGSVSSSGPASRADLYSELSLNNRNKDFVHFTKVSKGIDGVLPSSQMYFGAILSGDSLSNEKEIYNDNYAAPVVGLRKNLEFLPITPFVEFRQVFPQFAKSGSEGSQTEFRAGVVGGAFLPLWRIDEGMRYFNDVYGEGIYSSRLENNIFFNLSNKFGLQKKWDHLWLSQAYGELYGRRDRLGHYYENLQEIRLGLRQKLILSNLEMALSSHLANGSYADRQYQDPNPYGKSYTETAVLFVIGGSL